MQPPPAPRQPLPAQQHMPPGGASGRQAERRSPRRQQQRSRCRLVLRQQQERQLVQTRVLPFEHQKRRQPAQGRGALPWPAPPMRLLQAPRPSGLGRRGSGLAPPAQQPAKTPAAILAQQPATPSSWTAHCRSMHRYAWGLHIHLGWSDSAGS